MTMAMSVEVMDGGADGVKRGGVGNVCNSNGGRDVSATFLGGRDLQHTMADNNLSIYFP